MNEIKFLAIHIRPLDDDNESKEIIGLLKKAIDKKWLIERPRKETNAIFIPIKSEKDDNEKLLEAKQLLKSLNKKTINSIKNYDLSISLRIHHNNFYLSLPDFLISECGRLGIGIDILNEKLGRLEK